MASGEGKMLFGEPVDQYVKSSMGRVRAVLKLAMDLQGLQNYSDYQDVNSTLVTFKRSLTQIIQDVLYHQDISLRLVDQHRLQDKFELLRDANDCLMEKINSELDDAQGIRRLGTMDMLQPSVTAASANRRNANQSNPSMLLMASRNVQKPQLFFQTKVDNSAKTPFMPIITDKPNSKKPLAIMLCMTEGGTEYYSHPYEYELQHWTPSESYLSTPVAVQFPPDPRHTPLVMIDTPAMLKQMVGELNKCTHIAVDVEHHAFRSYLGLTSLIQVSSRTKDYIVDPIELRGELTRLNEIFTDPRIVKVIHGADSDVLWLQRDCGLYLLNMFDTHLAAVVLDFPQRSLAALLQTYCKIQADKRYQRADWRIRPLPQDFIEYARQDTHYLLYIYNCLHNLLLERANGATNLIRAVYDRSVTLCLKRYEKPAVGPDSYLQLYHRSRKQFNNRQEYALRELYLWRDKVARDHDESTGFVLPRHMLLQIAEVLPKEMQGVLACCNPIPSLVKTEQLNIHAIIRAALDQTLRKVVESRLDVAAPTIESSTRCLHDLSHVPHEADSLPCLLDEGRDTEQETMFGDLFQENNINVPLMEFSILYGTFQRIVPDSKNVKSSAQFLSPFERCRLYMEKKGKLPVFEAEPVKAKKKSAASKKNRSSLMEEERIARVREHFMSLTGPSTARQPPQEDEDRMARLFAHVKSAIPVPEDDNDTPKRSVVLKTTTFDNGVATEHSGKLAATSTSYDSSDDSSSSSSDDSDSDDDNRPSTAASNTNSTSAAVAAAQDNNGKEVAESSSSDDGSDDDSESEDSNDKPERLGIRKDLSNADNVDSANIVSKEQQSSSDDSSSSDGEDGGMTSENSNKKRKLSSDVKEVEDDNIIRFQESSDDSSSSSDSEDDSTNTENSNKRQKLSSDVKEAEDENIKEQENAGDSISSSDSEDVSTSTENSNKKQKLSSDVKEAEDENIIKEQENAGDSSSSSDSEDDSTSTENSNKKPELCSDVKEAKDENIINEQKNAGESSSSSDSEDVSTSTENSNKKPKLSSDVKDEIKEEMETDDSSSSDDSSDDSDDEFPIEREARLKSGSNGAKASRSSSGSNKNSSDEETQEPQKKKRKILSKKVVAKNPKPQPEKVVTKNSKAQSKKVGTKNLKAQPEKVVTKNSKAQAKKVGTKNLKAQPEKVVTKNSKAQLKKVGTKNPKAQPEKVVTKNPKAQPEKVGTKNPKAQPEKVVTKNSRAQPEKVVTKNPKAQPEKVVTKNPKAQPEQPKEQQNTPKQQQKKTPKSNKMKAKENFSELNKNKRAAKRKSGEMEVEPFNYDSADFGMFAVKKFKRGRGGRGSKSRGRGGQAEGAKGGDGSSPRGERGGKFSPRGGSRGGAGGKFSPRGGSRGGGGGKFSPRGGSRGGGKFSPRGGARGGRGSGRGGGRGRGGRS